MNERSTDSGVSLEEQIDSLIWYHTVDLGNGRTTPGIYDLRPYLGAYGLPKSLSGQSCLDVGAASGFFSFELESRGADVTAIDLPTWSAHDFGPLFESELPPQRAEQYLHHRFRWHGGFADRQCSGG